VTGTVAEVNTRGDTVRAYLGSFETGDPDAVAAFVTTDFVNEHLSELGSGCTGRDEYRRRLPQFLSTFAGARYSIVSLAEVVDTTAETATDTTPETATGSDAGSGGVVARYRFEATYDGVPIDIPGVMWFDVRDGLVARRTDLWDSLTFLRQTGQAGQAG
jgi:ketosteroid isomerase-like protein